MVSEIMDGKIKSRITVLRMPVLMSAPGVLES